MTKFPGPAGVEQTRTAGTVCSSCIDGEFNRSRLNPKLESLYLVGSSQINMLEESLKKQDRLFRLAVGALEAIATNTLVDADAHRSTARQALNGIEREL